MITRLLARLGFHVLPPGYVAVADYRLAEYAETERELLMFKSHLSHRWQVRVRNRDAQERALQNLHQLGLSFDGVGESAEYAAKVMSDAEFIAKLEGEVG